MTQATFFPLFTIPFRFFRIFVKSKKMQAIILAAGMGKRLGTLTRNNTKCMVKVNGIRIIDRMLSQLRRLDLERIIVVLGYKGNNLKKHIEKSHGDLPVEFVWNPIYAQTNNIYSLYLTKEKLAEKDTLLLESDLVFHESLLDKICNHPFPNVALIDRYQAWMNGTMVCINENLNIIDFIPPKAFRFEDCDRYYKTVNIYKFSKEFLQTQYIPFLEAYNKALGNNAYYEQVLRIITLLDNCDLKGLPLSGEDWYEIDDAQDLDIAECIFGDRKRLPRIHSRFGGFWRFPKLKDFCYLVNPYFPPQKMLDEIARNLPRLIANYPSGSRVNNAILSQNFKLKADYVAIGNGAAEIIHILMKTCKGKVGIVCPTFEEYPNRLQYNQIIRYIPDNKDFHYSSQDLIPFFSQNPISQLVLINPDNPSGNLIEKKGLEPLLKWTKEAGITLILDESFLDFAKNGFKNSLLDNRDLEDNPQLIIIKSISKSYGIPGLRLGFAASSNVDLIASLRKETSIWNINSIAEFYLQIFTKYEKDYKQACFLLSSEREKFHKELEKIPFLRPIPSQANYILCEITKKYDAVSLSEILFRKAGILIKDCHTKVGFDGKRHIRIAVRNREDNNLLIQILKKL